MSRAISPVLRLFASYPRFGGRSQSVALGALCVAVAVAITLHMWNTAASAGNVAGGWMPINDAMKWWDCSGNLVSAAEPEVSCQVRPLYPVLVAGLSRLVGWDTLWLLLAQSVLLGLAACWLIREAVRLVGLAGAGLTALLIFGFMKTFAIGLLMTEAGGLIFGLPGMALLLRGAQTRGLTAVALGVAGISIGLAARAGAMLALPLLLAWSIFAARRWRRPVLTAAACVGLAAASGPLLHAGVLAAANGKLSNAGGNFAYVLYGLAMGGRAWTAVLEDHPEVVALRQQGKHEESLAMAYSLAFGEIAAHPGLLMRGLHVSFDRWRSTLLADAAPGWLLRPIQNLLLPAGLLALVWRRRSEQAQVLGVLFMGEALSAPWVFGDATTRAFTATMAVDALVSALGLQLLVRALVAAGRMAPALTSAPLPELRKALRGARGSLARLWAEDSQKTVLPGSPRFERGPAIMIGALVLLLGLPGVSSKPTVYAGVPAGSCATGLTAVSFEVSRAFVLKKMPDDASVTPFEAVPGNYLVRRQAKNWYAPDLERMPAGTALIELLYLSSGSGTIQFLRVVWFDAPALHRGRRADVCVDTQRGEVVAGVKFLRVVEGSVR